MKIWSVVACEKSEKWKWTKQKSEKTNGRDQSNDSFTHLNSMNWSQQNIVHKSYALFFYLETTYSIGVYIMALFHKIVLIQMFFVLFGSAGLLFSGCGLLWDVHLCCWCPGYCCTHNWGMVFHNTCSIDIIWENCLKLLKIGPILRERPQTHEIEFNRRETVL